MIALLLSLWAHAADSAPLMAAVEAEVGRAASLTLPDQPAPYLIFVEVLDGEVATASADLGALTSFDEDPYRSLRAEVRVGSYEMDSSNFEGGFGGRDGVISRALPTEDVPLALQREIWLSLDEAYKGATETFAAKQSARQGDDEARTPDYTAAAPLVTDPLPRADADGALIRARVTALTDALRAWPELEEGTALARDWQGSRLLMTTEGTRAWLPTGSTVVVVEAVTRAPDGSRLRDLRAWVAKRPDLLPSEAEMLAEVQAMATRLVALRDAPVEDDYLGPVIFEHQAAVELFRQLLPAQLAGTPPPERPPEDGGDSAPTPPTARLGRRVLPEGWTVTDDPAAWPNEAGGYAVDFEGVPATRVEAVRDGVVRDLLMSRIPRKDRTGSTGHGRGLGIDRRAGLPGVTEVDPKRAVSSQRMERRALALARDAGLPYVIVVERLTPPALTEGFEIAFSGDGPLAGLTPPLQAERLYLDGHREPVRGLGFVGVDVRALRDIAAAGRVGPPVGLLDGPPDRSRFNIGAVGGLPVTWIVPPVLITELELRGHGGGEPRVLPAP